MIFLQNLEKSITKNDSLLSIGLDPKPEKFSENIRNQDDAVFAFNQAIIDATHNLVAVYKPQIAEYSALGTYGITSLKKTIEYLHNVYPGIPVILDAKRADIGATSEYYAKEVFDFFQADAVTVNPYFGLDSLQPFFNRKEKGVIILCRTSNKSAGDFQDLEAEGKPLYLHVAEKVNVWNKTFGNCLLVVGATWPDEMRSIRAAAPDLFFLVPGIGAQGGDLEKTMKAGLREDRSGLLIHSSRSILYASTGEDFAEAARKEAQELRDMINSFR